MAKHMVQYLHFRILSFLLINTKHVPLLTIPKNMDTHVMWNVIENYVISYPHYEPLSTTINQY